MDNYPNTIALFNFIVVVILVVLGAYFFFSLGNVLGQSDMCKKYGAELHKGKCVIVERKEIKL